MQNKLIIWDFDGVIADTDSVWMKTFYQKILAEKNYKSDFETFYDMCGGMSVATIKKTFLNLGIELKDDFFEEIKQYFTELLNKDFPLVKNADTVIKSITKKQCLATGTPASRIAWKVGLSNLSDVFTDKNSFSSDFVEKGKPAPDIFLYAAKQMGTEPKDCIVIEDSFVGLQAAISAGMTPIAFVGCESNNNPKRIEKIKQMGVKHIFADYASLGLFLENIA